MSPPFGGELSVILLYIIPLGCKDRKAIENTNNQCRTPEPDIQEATRTGIIGEGTRSPVIVSIVL